MTVARHRNYAAPKLLAEGPNQVWSYGITKLKGPEKWNYCYLYVIKDIDSRFVAGWMVAPRESASLAEMLIEQKCMALKTPEAFASNFLTGTTIAITTLVWL